MVTATPTAAAPTKIRRAATLVAVAASHSATRIGPHKVPDGANAASASEPVASAGRSDLLAHAHVLEELRLYAPLVTRGSYLVVLDTLVEEMPASMFEDRPWGPGDNPMTAVREFMRESDAFEIDEEIKHRLIHGLDDVAMTLQRAERIDSFEAAGKADAGPVTTSL